MPEKGIEAKEALVLALSIVVLVSEGRRKWSQTWILLLKHFWILSVAPASQAVGHKLWVPPVENGTVICLFWMEGHFSNMSNDDMDDNEDSGS